MRTRRGMNHWNKRRGFLVDLGTLAKGKSDDGNIRARATRKDIIMARRYSRRASKDVEGAMRKRKRGKLKSGRSGKKVKSRKQAIAIGLSEARRKGKKVPKRKGRKSSRRKKR